MMSLDVSCDSGIKAGGLGRLRTCLACMLWHRTLPCVYASVWGGFIAVTIEEHHPHFPVSAQLERYLDSHPPIVTFSRLAKSESNIVELPKLKIAFVMFKCATAW